VWDTEDSRTEAPLARDTHCDAAFVVDELAEEFIQVPLVLVDVSQQHRQLLLKRQRVCRGDLCGRHCSAAPRGARGPQKPRSPKLSGALHDPLIFTPFI